MRVVIIEDEPQLAGLMHRALEGAGIDVRAVGDAETGLALARALDVDVVITDLTLPGINGIEACRRLRTFSDAYVIMVTGRATEVDRLVGLAAGADDYMTKPFYARELVARIHAMQRRPRNLAPAASAVRTFGALAIDTDAREVQLDGSTIDVSRTEYDILDALSAQPTLSMRRSQLLEQIWGPGWFGDDHVVDVHVSNLRRKLDDDPRDPRYIKTVRGFGYRMGSG
jgi:DNA-binding response OmpR family regulator